MSLINQYVLDCYYAQRWLRRINRCTPNSYCSDVQRAPKRTKGKWDWGKRVYTHKWAKRYRVDKDGSIKRLSRNHKPIQDNPVKVVSDFESLRCLYTYDELFGSGMTLGGHTPTHIWKANVQEDGLHSYPIPFVLHLQELFGVSVWICSAGYSYIQEDERYRSTVTYTHVTSFGGDRDVISAVENESNRTVLFWLFENKLVICDGGGISSW